MPDKVEELRKVAVYLCSRMSQAIRIFSAVCFLSLAAILFSCLWQNCRCFPAPGSEFFAQRRERPSFSPSGGQKDSGEIIRGFPFLKSGGEVSSALNLTFFSSYWLKLVWEQNPAEQPVLVGRLLCRRRVGLSEGYPSRAL